jgi:hypothetical protein
MVPDAVTRGTAATREEAMAKFRAAWKRAKPDRRPIQDLNALNLAKRRL